MKFSVSHCDRKIRIARERKGMREGDDGDALILTIVVVTRLHTFAITHQTVHFQ